MTFELEKILRQALFTEYVWSILQDDFDAPEYEHIDHEYYTHAEGDN